jgi:hypothetical protein
LSKAGRVAEWVKTALIVLLSVSALLLGWRTRLFGDVSSTFPLFGSVAGLMRGTAGAGESGGVTIKEAARPLVIVITNEYGDRFGARYDSDERNAVYDRASSIVGEALGSASAPSQISQDEWRAALSRAGVYFEYVSPVRLSVLDGWLGAHMPDIAESAEDVFLRRIFVAFGEDRSRIYYQDIGSGLFYGADTASAAGKAQELEMYSPNGAVFAFELGIAGSENAPYTLIMHGRYHPDIRAAIPGSAVELLDITLAAFGHSNEMYTTLPEGDGALRRIGTRFNIMVSAQGSVTYRRVDAPELDRERRTLNESEMIERARVIVADTIGGVSGSAEVFFDSLEYVADGSYSVIFNYYIAGGGVFLFEDGYAARITFTSGVVMNAELNYRHLARTYEYTRLLPESLALAAAGGEFMLYYSDTGAEIMQPSWVALS